MNIQWNAWKLICSCCLRQFARRKSVSSVPCTKYPLFTILRIYFYIITQQLYRSFLLLYIFAFENNCHILHDRADTTKCCRESGNKSWRSDIGGVIHRRVILATYNDIIEIKPYFAYENVVDTPQKKAIYPYLNVVCWIEKVLHLRVHMHPISDKNCVE